MRLYITHYQVMWLSKWLLEKDIAYQVVADASHTVKMVCKQETWGCFLSPCYGDAPQILQAWQEWGYVVQVATPMCDAIDCLLVSPQDRVNDPFVRSLIRKLNGTKMPDSPVDWEKCDGLVPVTTQDAESGNVLMQAFMDEIAFAETLATGRAVYFSRSRRKLWRKGEESGNVQLVKEMRIDCDRDSITLMVGQVGGAACHEGYQSCFYRKIESDGSLTIVGERVFDPTEVYKGK